MITRLIDSENVRRRRATITCLRVLLMLEIYISTPESAIINIRSGPPEDKCTYGYSRDCRGLPERGCNCFNTQKRAWQNIRYVRDVRFGIQWQLEMLARSTRLRPKGIRVKLRAALLRDLIYLEYQERRCTITIIHPGSCAITYYHHALGTLRS